MVRINLIDPTALADQHLIAEYNEMLMLLGYVKRYPARSGIPEAYCLGPGHIKFFKDKLRYIKKRHELLKKEMRHRNFVPTKTIRLSDFPQELRNNWRPSTKDVQLIKKRLVEKISLKPEYYRYCGEHKSKKFFLDLIRNAKLPRLS